MSIVEFDPSVTFPALSRQHEPESGILLRSRVYVAFKYQHSTAADVHLFDVA